MSNNQLIKIENEALFSPSELIIIKARQDVQIHFKNRLELESSISDLLYKIYYYLGYKINDEEMTLMAATVMQDMLIYFRWQTLEEIRLAFEKGSQGEYGEFIGLNAARFNSWMRHFLSDRKRTDALAKELRLKEVEKKEPTKEELFAQSKAFALAAFEKFKADGSYNDIGNPVYEFLDSIQLIPFSVERKKEMFELAKEKIKAKANPAYAVNQAERTSFTAILESIEANGKDVQERIKVEARKIALNTYFSELVEMDTNLMDLM